VPAPWNWVLIGLLVGIPILTLAVRWWGSISFLWGLARFLGWIGFIWRVGWVKSLVGLVVVFLVVWRLFSLDAWLHLPKNWFNPWIILATYLAACILIWLLISVWKARRQLVVEEFKNYAGDDLNANVSGLAMLLVVRLGQFHDLYRAVDEQRANPTSALQSESIDAAIDVENVGADLKGAVSSQSTLGVGPLTIPVGMLMSLFGGLVQGPRIIGSLHKDKDMLILTAQCTREGSSFKWRVDHLIPSEQASSPSPGSVSEMLEELACRIFTDLALSSSVRWRATLSFSQGLRAYRECLRTPKNRRANLKEAENKFIETLTEDTKFSLAYYNLGVVHTELGNKKAAKTAFEQAIAQDPTSWAAYYARAWSCSDGGEYYRSILLCKRVIELKPGQANRAKAYQLLASVQHQPAHKTGRDPDFPAAIKNCKKAIRHAFLALFWAEIVQRGNDKIAKLRTLLVVCVTDLARIYNKQASGLPAHKAAGKLKKAENLLKRLRSLKSSDASYYALYLAELAETYHLQVKYAEATRLLRVATRIASDHVEYWGDLAVAYANAVTRSDKSKDREKFDPEYQDFIFRTILDFASDKPQKEFGNVLVRIQKAYEELAKKEPDQAGKCERIKSIRNFLDLGIEISKKGAKAEGDIPDLETELQKYRGNALNFAQVALALGRLYLKPGKDGQPGESNTDKFCRLVGDLDELERALTAGDGKNKEWEHGQILRILALLYTEAGEVKRIVTGRLAQRESKENLERASEYYTRAIEVLEKKHPREVKIQGVRSKLATTLLELDRHQEALQLAQKAMLFDALAYDNHEVLGDVYAERGDFEDAIDVWKEAILRRDAMPLDSYGPELHVKIGKSYVRLAQLHSEMCLKQGKNQEAVNYMQQALKCCSGEHLKEKLEIYYSLGYFYFALGEYGEALKYLRLAQNFGFAPLTSTFCLAYAYLRNREYDASITKFRSLQEMTQGVQGRPEKIVEKDSVGYISLGEMKALAYWGQAFAYAERDANLRCALELAEKALEQIEPMMEASCTILQFPARYTDCKGWILHKLGETDEAIKYLEQSIAREAQAETYLHLALAYESKFLQTSDKAQKRLLLSRVQAYCQHACELDVNESFCQQVEQLLQRQHLQKPISSQFVKVHHCVS
jgi:tetratricopeptide (TPR) repeat protein